ncbi:exosortase A-associated hydrolase 1 [Novosphingobium sp. PhB165]|uniref:hydrolase 1, exosortase A system-associated n=1 Tax=Novosphingobium sp. PhB165 TaxID=2485105 RepID=UPI0010452168|nr:hydrolase 1, exosortase A system-associated [Novosphingobium sp. PhB165]TCM22324.1 exosortase A-associated hydrolase 1 [Novosphingobium sp. PhB165]
MNRRHFSFACESAQLAATLDDASGTTALLIVSGGNETRAGAWNSQALLAARVAAEGYPVLRFDRRGVGDSEGDNRGFRSSAPDIAAALAALRTACPQVMRVVGFGNCDAASALMLAGGAGFDALILSNPWTFAEDSADEPPAEVVRNHYRRRLGDAAALKRLLTGKVAIGPLLRSLFAAARPIPGRPKGLAAEIASGVVGFRGPIRFPIAGRDRTGLAFLANWDKSDDRLRICSDATHSYVEPEAQDWLFRQVLEILRTTAH